MNLVVENNIIFPNRLFIMKGVNYNLTRGGSMQAKDLLGAISH